MTERDGEYQCPDCNQSFSTEEERDEHIAKEHGEGPRTEREKTAEEQLWGKETKPS